MNTQAQNNLFENKSQATLIPIRYQEKAIKLFSRIKTREDKPQPDIFSEDAHLLSRRKQLLPTQARYSGFVARLVELIEANIDNEKYDINQLCRDAGASRSTIHKQLKYWTGLSTSFFIRRIRLHKAKEILLTSDLNITQVAYEVGFKDPHYFTRVFTDSFGVSPKEFRKCDCVLKVV